MLSRLYTILIVGAGLCVTGCHSDSQSGSAQTVAAGPHDIASAANKEFLGRQSYDPWVLSANGDQSSPAYLSDGKTSCLVDGSGKCTAEFVAGHYVNAQLTPVSGQVPTAALPSGPALPQSLNLRTGTLQTGSGGSVTAFTSPDLAPRNWVKIWANSDLVIDGDPEAQQVVHANLFYLLASTCPGSRHSIPPMGLSSTDYGGHIFWDADTWMFPALIVQHPDFAKSIVDYRFDTLPAAMKIAQSHGLPGAEYAWESAGTGNEVAPAEFAQERHITADVALAAWQYYLWTGDAQFFQTEAWPIMEASADYWARRVNCGADGAYHIKQILPPDETAGLVDDDAYTNGAARATLTAAAEASDLLHISYRIEPMWRIIAAKIAIPMDKGLGFPAEHAAMPARFAAKQADTLLLLYPLNAHYDPATAGNMLDYYAAHTIPNGPAMTSGINAVIAARLGRASDALQYYRDSYRPFMRGPWDAFAEKRTSNNVYFLTGMAGSLQSVLYGFAGLRVVVAGETAPGRKLAGDSVASLYADPHLPPGWGKLVVQGIHFRGKVFDLTVDADNRVTVVNR